jgi:hypothetical protein
MYRSTYSLTRQQLLVRRTSLPGHFTQGERDPGRHWIGGIVGPTTGLDNKKKLKTPWSESASKLYRPNDRRLSAKRLPTCADRGCHVVSVTDPSGRILSVFLTGAAAFPSSSSSVVLTKLSGPRSRPTTFFW